MFSVYIYIIYI